MRPELCLFRTLRISDGLTNGQQGTVKDVDVRDGRVHRIFIKFDNSNIVTQQRNKFNHLTKVTRNIEWIPIEKSNHQYTLGDVSKNHGARASLIQFPLRLSWAMTSHKCQGQSILEPNNIRTDLNEVFEGAQSYVILSRITCLAQLHLTPFKPEKIWCNSKAKEEAVKLKTRAVNLQRSDWNTNMENTVKIITLNIRSLGQHQQD